MSRPVRVVLADDQALVRSGFAMVLSVEDDVEVVGQAANGAEVLGLLATTEADVVLMDVQMPVMDGIEATREVVSRGLAKVVILTTFDREDYLFDGLAAGASGFLLKNADPDDLVDAIRAVADGHALLSPEVTLPVIARLVATAGRGRDEHLPDADADAGVDAARPARRPSTPASLPPETARTLASLTPREREVLVLVGEGLSNGEIAARLYLGESTVKTHVSHILTKTGSRDRVQAVVLAHRAGLVGPA